MRRQLLLFAGSDRLRRLDRVAPVAAAAHLDDRVHALGIERDDVGFAPATAIVALKNLVAARFEIARGQRFAGLA